MKCDELEYIPFWSKIFYSIPQVDEAIAELKAEINKYKELLYGKTEYHSVLAMCAIYGCKDVREFHDTINTAIDRSNTQINHQKHKRCLSTAKMLDRNATNTKFMLALETDPARIEKLNKLIKHYYKWSNKWLEIANQFKEI